LLRSVSRDVFVDEVSISAADPLNLVAIVTPGERVPALSGNRVLFEEGSPLAVQAGRDVLFLRKVMELSQWRVRNILLRKQVIGGPPPRTPTTH
jgi:ATP-dependent Lhr-like helicase